MSEQEQSAKGRYGLDGMSERQAAYIEALIEWSRHEEGSAEYERIADDVLDPLWYSMTHDEAVAAAMVYHEMRQFAHGDDRSDDE